MDTYYPVMIKLALGILCLIFQINLMGKGNLAPTSAMDQVQNYVLGGIIGGVIYNEAVTPLQFFLVLIIWTLLVFIIKFLKEHNRYVKRVVDGRPVTLVVNGSVEVGACLRCGMSANELMFKLRSAGIYEINHVKRAIMEQNGQLTIIQYGDENIRYPIIVDGQANQDVLDLIDKDIHWLEAQIKQRKYNSLSDIYLGEYISGELRLHGYSKQ
ncbi:MULTISPECIES: DUF421 domain-containing protein [Paenibacillus]|uniref:DUF421 domain-containing protein n=1 Tax=Paenibacillus TaxID=44249 RepID=UPI00037F7340|nr:MULTISPECIES: DUF421 domain-containing protein [Paenibacillus]